MKGEYEMSEMGELNFFHGLQIRLEEKDIIIHKQIHQENVEIVQYVRHKAHENCNTYF